MSRVKNPACHDFFEKDKVEERFNCESDLNALFPKSSFSNVVSDRWQENFQEVINAVAEQLQTKGQTRLEIVSLSAQIQVLEDRLEKMIGKSACVVPIQTLSPEPFELTRPLQVMICRGATSEWQASFLDANINASGDNEAEAIENLKDMIVATFEMLQANQEKLGPFPTKQFAVLQQFLRPTKNEDHHQRTRSEDRQEA
jgi:hypothetical protein